MAYSLTYTLSSDGQSYSVTGYSGITTSDNVVIESTYNEKPVTSIGVWAFKECSDLTRITIGSNITYIDDSAFAWCDKLMSITIPSSVTSIGLSAFVGCSSLTDVVFENNSQLAVISANMFQSCTSLKSLTVPSSVTSIDTSAFYDCSSLTNIIIPSSVGEIGEQAFYNCNSLINITVDESNPSYKSVNGSLYTKDGTMLIQYASGQPVTIFSIPYGVTTIYPNAFLNCTSLVNVTIPDSDSEIKISSGAFRGCSSLKQLILFPSTPPTLGSNAIPSNVQSIYVQQSAEAAYKVALNWAAFASKIVGDNIYLSFVRFNQKNKEYIDKKLTKPTNPSAESAVTMLADGTVGTKLLSEIGGGGKLYRHVFEFNLLNVYGEEFGPAKAIYFLLSDKNTPYNTNDFFSLIDKGNGEGIGLVCNFSQGPIQGIATYQAISNGDGTFNLNWVIVSYSFAEQSLKGGTTSTSTNTTNFFIDAVTEL